MSIAPSGSPIAPIHGLPSEILGQVFEYVVREVTTTLEHPEPGYLPTNQLSELHRVHYPERIAQVCRYWYSQATTQCSLWTFLALNSGLDLGPYSDVESYVRNRISKSGNYPLTVRIERPDDDYPIRAALKLAIGIDGSVAVRWKHLVVEGLTISLSEHLSYPMPSLESLDIDGATLDNEHRPHSLFPCVPSLTKLRRSDMCYHLIPHPMNLQITTLDLSESGDDLIPLLKEFPNVEWLRLYAAEMAQSDANPVFEMPRLTTLIFADPFDVHLLSQIDAPILLHLQVGHPSNPGRRIPASPEILTIPNPLDSVLSLTLASWEMNMGAKGMRRLFESLPSLVNVTMHNMESKKGLVQTLSCLDDPTLCPNLRVCNINGEDFDQRWVSMRVQGLFFSFLEFLFKAD